MAVPSSMLSHQCPVNAKWLSRVIKLNYYELLQIYLSSGHVSNVSVTKSDVLTIYQIFFKYKKLLVKVFSPDFYSVVVVIIITLM